MNTIVRIGLRLAVAGSIAVGALATQPAAGPSTTGSGTGLVAATPLVPVASRNQVDTRSREAVTAAYRTRWQSSDTAALASGGQGSSCRAAATKASEQTATLSAINFARGLVGENAVTFTDAYNAAAARSAVISAANHALSHDPPSSWKCWTQAGHDASASSNIMLGSPAPTAAGLIGDYLGDAGSSNTAAGHRRWLLRPEATTMGSGNAQGSDFANAIYVLTSADDYARAAAKAYYAWPSAGWFPTQLEPGGRWSLSSSTGASFASAKVTVKGPDGAAVAVKRRKPHDGYADNTLVWDLKNPPAAAGSTPSTYAVRVTGVTGGPKASYTYRVRLFDPTAADAS